MRASAVVAALTAVLVVPAAAEAPAAQARGVFAARATAALEALERRLVDRRTNAYREAARTGARARAWPASQAAAATIAAARIADSQARDSGAARTALARLERFRSGTLYGAWPGGDVYYDDNEWIARDLLDAYEAWRRPSDLAGAERIFRGIVHAWDARPAQPCAGGVRWTSAAGNSDRNTVTTANGAVVALRLYRETRRPSYLAWGRRMLGWLERCMRAPNGLYWDHVDARGRVDTTQWSYNQGSIVEANLLLHRVTGDRAPLARAEELADASLDALAGRLDGDEPPEFAAVFYRALLQLAARDGRTSYVDAAAAYGRSLWRGRDSRSGLVFGTRTRLLDQAAAVQTYAYLARAGR